MKKIPMLFEYEKVPGKRKLKVTKTPNSLCQWVFDNEGVARRKYDGSCCMIKDGLFYKRRTVKKNNAPHKYFRPVDWDYNTGKTYGWISVDICLKENKYHYEALLNNRITLTDGTYELCGPKIQGNPENLDRHVLIPHSEAEIYYNVPRDYDDLKNWIEDRDIEGLVFHHPDGRMAKIRKADFGLPRKKRKANNA